MIENRVSEPRFAEPCEYNEFEKQRLERLLVAFGDRPWVFKEGLGDEFELVSMNVYVVQGGLLLEVRREYELVYMKQVYTGLDRRRLRRTRVVGAWVRRAKDRGIGRVPGGLRVDVYSVDVKNVQGVRFPQHWELERGWTVPEEQVDEFLGGVVGFVSEKRG